MKQVWTTRAHRLTMGLAALWALLLLIAFALRITFPLELEWMEDGALHQARRIQLGAPIYAPPSPQWVPYLYTPLYPMVLAALGHVLPLGFVLGRLVSIAASIAVAVALWRLVGREGKPRAHQAAAVGLFCAGFIFGYRWLDVARGDALFLALTLWSLVMLRESWGSWRRALLAGVLMALAFWTKQTAAVFIVASGLAAMIVAPRQLWVYALTIAVLDGGGVILGQALTDGWLWNYIFELHQAHEFNQARFTRKIWGMFVHAAPFLTLLLLGLTLGFLRPWMGRTRRLSRAGDQALHSRLLANRGLLYWAVIFVSSLLVSALGYSTQWAELNAFIPAICFGAALIAVALPKGGRAEIVSLGLVAAQMIFSLALEPRFRPLWIRGLAGFADSYTLQDPFRTVPTRAARARAAAMRRKIEGIEGGILAIHRPWWSVLAGGDGHVSAMGMHDVPEEDRDEIRSTLRRNLRDGIYEVVWHEGEPGWWLRRALARSYVVERRYYGSARVRPLVGYMSEAGMATRYSEPQLWLVRPRPRPAPEGATLLADFENGSLEGFIVTGGGFGRRAVRSIPTSHAAVGPIGGEYLMSSAARPVGAEAQGEARSPVFRLPAAGGAVEMLVGYGGSRKLVTLELVAEDGGESVAIPLRRNVWSLSSHRWDVPVPWGGRDVRLHLVDRSEKGAIFLDDLWLLPPAVAAKRLRTDEGAPS